MSDFSRGLIKPGHEAEHFEDLKASTPRTRTINAHDERISTRSACFVLSSSRSIFAGLVRGQTFSSKHFLRSRLARTLRGSLRSSTKPPDSYTGHLARPAATESLSPSHFTETKGLATVFEEDPVDDWVDDFEPISRDEIAELEVPPPEPDPPRTSLSGSRSIDNPLESSEPLVRTTSERSHSSDPFATPSNYRSPADSIQPYTIPSRPSSAPPDRTPVTPVRSRTTSRASKRSLRSSRRHSQPHDPHNLRLILDFPTPPNHIPTPISNHLSPPIEAPTPIADDSSIFYDKDPFRADSINLEREPVERPASPAKTDPTTAGSSASFHTALSRAPTPTPTQASSTGTATLRRLGSFAREAKDSLRASFRTPISEISSTRSRKPKRVQRVFAEKTPESPSTPKVSFDLLPEFIPEGLDFSFPQFDNATPRSPKPAPSAPFRPSRLVKPYYTSLDNISTSHILQNQELSPRTRLQSAPSLFSPVNPVPETEQPENSTQPAFPPPIPRPPPPNRPLPPLPFPVLPPPKFAVNFEFVNPLDLTASPAPSTQYRYSAATASFAPSPSWLSRNVRELELYLANQGSDSPESIHSAVADVDSDTSQNTDLFDSSVRYSIEVESPSSPSPIPVPSQLPLPRPAPQSVYLQGQIPIHNADSSTETFHSVDTFTETTAEPVTTPSSQVTRSRTRSRRTSSTATYTVLRPGRSPSRVSSPRRPRSRNSSVARATITHYRRSITETRKKQRTISSSNSRSTQRSSQTIVAVEKVRILSNLQPAFDSPSRCTAFSTSLVPRCYHPITVFRTLFSYNFSPYSP